MQVASSVGDISILSADRKCVKQRASRGLALLRNERPKAGAFHPIGGFGSGCTPAALNGPQRPPNRCRALSRSSGVMRSHFSAIRRRILDRLDPIMPWPPKSIRQRINSPSASQNVISCHPVSPGTSQFQSRITISPPRMTNTTIPRIASGAMKYHFLRMFPTSLSQIRRRCFAAYRAGAARHSVSAKAEYSRSRRFPQPTP